jgi:hypothetical protein
LRRPSARKPSPSSWTGCSSLNKSVPRIVAARLYSRLGSLRLPESPCEHPVASGDEKRPPVGAAEGRPNQNREASRNSFTKCHGLALA